MMANEINSLPTKTVINNIKGRGDASFDSFLFKMLSDKT